MCLGEVARKIDRDVVAPYVCGLLETLKMSFRDERWHVRDAACLTAGTIFSNFSHECQGMLEVFLPLFFENLQFPISIVRQGAAAALANVVRGYSKAVLPKILDKIAEGLNGIESQLAETIENSDLPQINPELVSVLVFTFNA